MLVTLNNSLFGIPASHITFEVSAGSDAGVGAAAAEQCEVPLEERLAREQQQQPGGSPGSALAVFQPQHHGKRAQGSQAAEAQCKPTDAEMCAATTLLGVYAVQHSGSDLMLLPPASNSSAGQGQQDGTAVGKTGVLLLLVSAAMGGAASVVVVAMVAWRRTAAAVTAQQQVEQQQQQQTPPPAVAQDVSSGRARRRGSTSGKRQQQQMSNRLKGLVQQAASDDATGQQTAAPGAAYHARSRSVALTSAAQQDEGLPSSAAVAAGLMDPAMRRREMQDGVILIGRMRVRSYACANATFVFVVSVHYYCSLVIHWSRNRGLVVFPACALQVGPAVLGYGSGGTVVFSGELDGRPVAVKRMLRQFYEVARKEIDALILADEHPNIVRWAYVLLRLVSHACACS